MGRFQNAEFAIFDGVGEYDVPEISPIFDIPSVDKYVEFDYCKRVRGDRSKIAVHFFEDDYKFERVWTNPNRYGEMLKEFAYIIGPDFSQYIDFPKSVQIYNHYRNNWLVKYWQICYNMNIIPTVMRGKEDSYDWCFDGYPKNSIVAVSNVGLCQDKELKKMFLNGYNEMLKRLNPSKVLVFTRNFEKLPGNVQYVRWELHKGDQLNGNR